MKTKIKTFIDSKTFYVILSIVLAICAWLLVLSYTNPIKTRTLEVPIQFLNQNAPANLDLQDQTVTYPKTATVTVTGREDVINNLSASEIKTTVDLSQIAKAGTTTLKVSKPVCDRLGVSVGNYYPKTIDFTYDTVIRKNLEVKVNTDQSLLKEGYEFLTVTPNLSSIPVSGLASLLESCDHIKVDLTESIDVGSLDSNRTIAVLGRYISVTGEDITHRFKAETIMVDIQIAKKVVLNYTTSGTPNADYYLNKVSVSPSYVLVVGDYATLSNLTTLNLGTINVNGATKNTTMDVNVEGKLPAGVSLVQSTTAKITAEVLKYTTKEFTVNLSNLSLPGQDTGRFNYQITPETVVVSVKGRQDDISKLTLAKMAPTLNLDGKTIGTYNVALTFSGLDASRYTVMGEYLFTVVISNVETDDDDPSHSPTPADVTSATRDTFDKQ